MRNITPSQEWDRDDDDLSTLDASVSTSLREYFPKHFPALRASVSLSKGTENADSIVNESDIRVEYEWIGIMGFSKDRNPLVGPLAGRSGEYIAAGYTGHGMPVAYLAAQNITDMICNTPQGDRARFIAEAFLPARFGL